MFPDRCHEIALFSKNQLGMGLHGRTGHNPKIQHSHGVRYIHSDSDHVETKSIARVFLIYLVWYMNGLRIFIFIFTQISPVSLDSARTDDGVFAHVAHRHMVQQAVGDFSKEK